MIKHITAVLVLLRFLVAWPQTNLNWPFVQLFPLCIPTHCFPHRQIPEIQSRFLRDAFCPSLWAVWADCFGGGGNALSKFAHLEVRMGCCLGPVQGMPFIKKGWVFFCLSSHKLPLICTGKGQWLDTEVPPCTNTDLLWVLWTVVRRCAFTLFQNESSDYHLVLAS